MARYNNTDETIKAIRDRFNVYFEIPCDSDDRRVQEIIGIVIRTIKEQPTADVVPKSEVARLEQDVTRLAQENETLKDSNEHLAVMLEETKIELEAMRGAANSYKIHYETAKAEAVKEFAERLKEEACYFGRAVAMEDIDNIAKELTGGGVCETNTTTER